MQPNCRYWCVQNRFGDYGVGGSNFGAPTMDLITGKAAGHTSGEQSAI